MSSRLSLSSLVLSIFHPLTVVVATLSLVHVSMFSPVVVVKGFAMVASTDVRAGGRMRMMSSHSRRYAYVPCLSCEEWLV